MTARKLKKINKERTVSAATVHYHHGQHCTATEACLKGERTKGLF